MGAGGGRMKAGGPLGVKGVKESSTEWAPPSMMARMGRECPGEQHR